MSNRIAIIIVVYREKIEELPCYDYIKKYNHNKALFFMIYDNSPTAQNPQKLAELQVEYFHNSDNPGLAVAYNFGYEQAKEKNCSLLLLLDQDTVISTNYFEHLLQHKLEENTVAILPHIEANGKMISPVVANQYFSSSLIIPKTGISRQPLMAINSGTALPLRTVKEIGGFNEEFPLDFLDHWLFWRLNQLEKEYLVLEDCFQHELSVLNYNDLSLSRYESILSSETKYYSKYNIQLKKDHKKHLYKRLCKQFLLVKNRKIWKRTVAEIKKMS